MKSPLPEIPEAHELIEALKARIADPARKILVATIGAKLAVLVATQALGQPEIVEREIAHVKSQLASLSATEVFVVREVTSAWLTRLITGVLFKALSA